jgi:hypothetical protein
VCLSLSLSRSLSLSLSLTLQHLYYFSSVGPSLLAALGGAWLVQSPFIFLWNGMHLLLSPAASHSGWEDHFQSDQFHYLHHNKFECNYGSASLPLDHLFGTFRDRLQDSQTYRGGGGAASSAASAVAAAKKKDDDADGLPQRAGQQSAERFSPVRMLPKRDFAVFFTFTAAAFLLAAAALAPGSAVDGALGGVGATLREQLPRSVAALLAFGPIAFGCVLRVLNGDSLPFRWPFHREQIAGKFGCHVAVGFAISVVPVYCTVLWALL